LNVIGRPLVFEWLQECFNTGRRTTIMQYSGLKFYVRIQRLLQAFAQDQSGQDLIEYALVVSLIALAATVSMKGVATAIGTAFTSVSTKLGTYTS
jgi:pilus assembly protein Flp/PilA